MTFDQALRIAGLMPRDIVADGKIRRCKTETHPGKRNGWYVLHADAHGAWGDWSSGSGAALGSWKDENSTQQAVSPDVVAKMAAQREQARQYRIQAVRSAREFWHQSRPLSQPHPYIAAKGLQPLGCAGLRVNDGLLVVPVMLGDSLISIQTITPEGEKRFWPGAPVKAGAYTLRRDRSAITVAVEGLANGLALYQSVRNSTVIVCFDAGNMVPVVDRMRPTGSVVIFADNDHGTMVKRGFNPGLDAARNAAELIGCGVAYAEGIEGTDAADCIREWGQGANTRIERLALAKAKFISPVAS